MRLWDTLVAFAALLSLSHLSLHRVENLLYQVPTVYSVQQWTRRSMICACGQRTPTTHGDGLPGTYSKTSGRTIERQERGGLETTRACGRSWSLSRDLVANQSLDLSSSRQAEATVCSSHGNSLVTVEYRKEKAKGQSFQKAQRGRR